MAWCAASIASRSSVSSVTDASGGTANRLLSHSPSPAAGAAASPASRPRSCGSFTRRPVPT
ncbi:hypothetical protein BJF78_33200 [Pseudonocardia sp. CNS-139]|nr:hypothetical protein BJF78_33200 [Pseudonocardia sp. CNS-139]